MDDPFEMLGLTRSANLADVRQARRRLAFDAHPDRGGDPERMRELNAAFEAAVAHVTGRRLLADPQAAGADPASRAPDGKHSAAKQPTPQRSARERTRWRVERDIPSFVIEALPAEAFEALLVVTANIGELLIDEPPFVLEVFLTDPEPCWCRLDLVPDAGSSTVSLTVAGFDGAPAPDPEVVRDVWIRELNRL